MTLYSGEVLHGISQGAQESLYFLDGIEVYKACANSDGFPIGLERSGVEAAAVFSQNPVMAWRWRRRSTSFTK